MLRRFVLFTVSLSLVVISLAGSAVGSQRAERVERIDYIAGGVYGVVGVSGAGTHYIGAARFPGGDEKFLSVEIVDESGRPILAEVTQDLQGNIQPEVVHEICGGTTAPVPIEPRTEVIVYLYNGQCGQSASVPTSGTVTGTFSFNR